MSAHEQASWHHVPFGAHDRPVLVDEGDVYWVAHAKRVYALARGYHEDGFSVAPVVRGSQKPTGSGAKAQGEDEAHALAVHRSSPGV